LGDKVTPAVARMREAVVGNSLFSPFPFHSVYSVEDHKKHVDWIKEVKSALLSVGESLYPTDVIWLPWEATMPERILFIWTGVMAERGCARYCQEEYRHAHRICHPQSSSFPGREGYATGYPDCQRGIRSAYDIAKAIALGGRRSGSRNGRHGGLGMPPLPQLRKRTGCREELPPRTRNFPS